MLRCVLVGLLGLTLIPGLLPAQSLSQDRLNPIIALIEQGLPVFGVAHPAYVAGGGRRPDTDAGAAAESARQPDLIEVARETVAYRLGDYTLNSYSPAAADRHAAYLRAILAAGGSARTHPFLAKIPIVHGNEDAAIARLTEQLNTGQVVITMQEVETVEEVDRVIAAMRFASKGGTRPSRGYSLAAAYWGMTEADYRERADVWPLNPNGELLLSAIIESKAGIANARAIAAIPGVSIVTVGSGTLGGVFTSTSADGRRIRDQAGFDAAVAKVLAACKEFRKACAYPANNPTEIDTLMKAGWDFFIMQRRNQDAFDAVETGRRLSGRPLKP